MRKLLLIIFAVLFCVACENKKKNQPTSVEPVVETILNVDTGSVAGVANVDSAEEVIPAEEILPPVNEYFDDFIFSFAQDTVLQKKRVIFPLPYYKEDTPLKVEVSEWSHDSLFLSENYYTILLDEEEELDLLGDTSVNSAQVEWMFLKDFSTKKYYFEKIDGRWMLEAVNQHAVINEKRNKFLEFYRQFAADSAFQVKHICDPLAFVTTDPDDDFAVLETSLDINQWFAFKPELPQEWLTNISYGQEDKDESSTKIVQLKGVGNGFINTFFFRKKNGKWELYKFEDFGN
ncbi:DUF4348 domain-containing protein [Bacteroides sp. 224]|uniref:DUF4348 domain-containing protein n=1 Tax=Bacteroides sp. 224 TaxID=2302936 RepID=UPI0013D5E87E|nr:DUF4348 domain-containing protein [Bacteroides sp. 224]NDV65768.1 DUF4348 domain-containing protein [Bacteroides sp. 224]